MPLIVKGKLIDENNPIICVPILNETYDEIIQSATRLSNMGCDMVEWRVDYFEGLLDSDELDRTMSALKSILKNVIFLVTLRSKNEGGKADFDEETTEKLLCDIAIKRCADIIDIEYFQYANPLPLIKKIQESSALALVSHHDFEKTPSRQVNYRLLETMAASDPDMVKLCVKAEKPSDVFSLGGAVAEFKEEGNLVPTIAIAMGNKGVISRSMPRLFGSCVTFGFVGENSAPGQIEYHELKSAMEHMDKWDIFS